MNNPVKFDEYLGDGIYVTYDGINVILKTGSHLNPENEIYLEPAVLKAFNDYVLSIKSKEAS
jgi:hypothetical protein